MLLRRPRPRRSPNPSRRRRSVYSFKFRQCMATPFASLSQHPKAAAIIRRGALTVRVDERFGVRILISASARSTGHTVQRSGGRARPSTDCMRNHRPSRPEPEGACPGFIHSDKNIIGLDVTTYPRASYKDRPSGLAFNAIEATPFSRLQRCMVSITRRPTPWRRNGGSV